jgi:peptide/nickel transport system substrate-binding protein
MKSRSSAATKLFSLVAAALVAFAAIPGAINVAASTRPHVGGTLRVEFRERVPTLDPRERPADAEVARTQELLDALVFDHLLRLDDRGEPAPALAIAMQSSDGGRAWRFQLRPGVQFSDGTPLTAEIAAVSLASELGGDAHVTAAGQWLTIESASAMPELPQRLATGRNFIYHVAADGKSAAGTGPFVVERWDSSASPAQAVLAANAQCWAGRPFVDRVAILLGIESPRIEADLEFGLADVGELAPAEMRLAAERGVRTWSSEPVDLFALTFDSSRPAVQNLNLREAIAAAVERSSIANFVLQRQAVPAGALLPEWISGYAFLFPSGPNEPPNALSAVAPPAPLILVYDSQDGEARAVAQRVTVDLRAAGIAASAVAGTDSSAASGPSADFRLVRVPIAQPDPRAALDLVLGALSAPAIGVAARDPESLYAAERAALADFRIVPLAHESENWGLGAAVRDWMAARWGDLRLDDVWLDLPAANPQ